MGIKKGSSYLETGYSKTGWSGKVGGGVYGGLWGRTACRRHACGAHSPAEFRLRRNVRPCITSVAQFSSGHGPCCVCGLFTNERRTVSRCGTKWGPSTNMKKRPAGRLYICTSVILLFHPVRRKDSFLPDPVQRGWALLRNRDFLLLPPEWVPPAVLFELSGSLEPSTHFQSNR